MPRGEAAWVIREVLDLGEQSELWERMGLNASRNEEAADSRTLLQRTTQPNQYRYARRATHIRTFE